MSSNTQYQLSETQALFRPAMVLMAGRFLGFAAAFFIPIILVRIFDQAEFGSYKQLFLVFGTLFGIAQLGIAESLYYFLPRAERAGGAFVRNAMLVLALMGLVCVMALSVWQESLARLLNNHAIAEYLPLVGIYLLFMLMAVLLEILMTVRKQHLAASCSYALSDLLRALFYIVPLAFLADLRLLLYGAIGFAVMRFIATGLYLRYQFRGQLIADKQALREHLAYAIPFGVAGLIEVGQINYHLYAVSYHFDAATFAIYAVGCLQIPLADFLMTSTSNVMMVNMMEKIKAQQPAAVLHIWLDSVRKLALVFFPMVAGLLLLAQPLIVLLFTDSYADSVPIFMVWTVSMLLITLLTDAALRVYADTRFLIVQNLIHLVLIVVLMPWFLREFDIIGAILVSLFAMVVVKVLALLRLASNMKVSLASLLPWESLLRALFVAIAAAIPALLLQLLWAPTMPLIELLVGGLLYSLSYYALLLRFGPMTDQEKQMLVQWLRKPFQRLAADCMS